MLAGVVRKDLVEGSDCLQLLLSRPGERVNSLVKQGRESIGTHRVRRTDIPTIWVEYPLGEFKRVAHRRLLRG